MERRNEKWRRGSILSMIILIVLASQVSTGPRRKARNLGLTEPLFEIFGMLDEYITRFKYRGGEPEPNLIERFYPGEVKFADRFESLLGTHADLAGLKKDWTRKIGKQGHIGFYSRDWSAMLNSFYIKVNNTVATLDMKIFTAATENEMLRFLRGAYERFGAEDKSSNILMYNAPFKTETIGLVLKKLGCRDVAVFWLGGMPASYQVHFNPSSVVPKNLGITRIVLKPGYFPEHWTIYKTIN